MEKQITELLIPFVTAVREEVNKLMPKLMKLQYHYGYSLTIDSTGKWFNDYEIKNFDHIININKEMEGNFESANLDILMSYNSLDNKKVESRFDHTLLIENDKFVIVATSTFAEGQFRINLDRINKRGIEELANEFVLREVKVNPFLN